jgi:hypothetical protein
MTAYHYLNINKILKFMNQFNVIVHRILHSDLKHHMIKNKI